MNKGNFGVTIFLFLLAVMLLFFVVKRDSELSNNISVRQNNPTTVEPEVNSEIIISELEPTKDEFDLFLESKRIAIYPKEGRNEN